MECIHTNIHPINQRKMTVHGIPSERPQSFPFQHGVVHRYIDWYDAAIFNGYVHGGDRDPAELTESCIDHFDEIGYDTYMDESGHVYVCSQLGLLDHFLTHIEERDLC